MHDDASGQEGEDQQLDPAERRARLMAAVEGGDWSAVIDGQTQETIDDLAAPPPPQCSQGSCTAGSSPRMSRCLSCSSFTSACLRSVVYDTWPAVAEAATAATAPPGGDAQRAERARRFRAGGGRGGGDCSQHPRLPMPPNSHTRHPKV